jgi:glycosyltransferase involved in cell wall biosynthesis
MFCLSAVDYCENGLGFLASKYLGQKAEGLQQLTAKGVSRPELFGSEVSLITVTQFVRYECLQTLYELIKLQTYNNILEWVIVEGSCSAEDGLKNKINIQKLIDYHYNFNNDNNNDNNNEKRKFNIVYLNYSGKKLSDLRNMGNGACKGDIIVCMDDDDYYPPERVQHAVESLENSPHLIAGCSDIYMYEYFLERLYKFKGFHSYHSTNNVMAFKREYLKKHRHASGLDRAEEASFTNHFTVPMVQLNPEKSIIVSSHNYNTYSKREMCISSSLGTHPVLDEHNGGSITHYIPPNIFNRIRNNFRNIGRFDETQDKQYSPV